MWISSGVLVVRWYLEMQKMVKMLGTQWHHQPPIPDSDVLGMACNKWSLKAKQYLSRAESHYQKSEKLPPTQTNKNTYLHQKCHFNATSNWWFI